MKLNILLILILLTAFIYSGDKKPGDKIEDFSLKGIDGNEYILSKSFSGTTKATVVMFWSIECPWVQAYSDRVNMLAKTYTDKGINFIGINSNNNESYDEAKTHASEKGYVFTMTKDENNKAADILGANRTPEIFVISPEMTILYHGRVDDNKDESKVTTKDLQNALDDILSGTEVKIKETKSFGCGIKR